MLWAIYGLQDPMLSLLTAWAFLGVSQGMPSPGTARFPPPSCGRANGGEWMQPWEKFPAPG